jgi:hypothetical protein
VPNPKVMRMLLAAGARPTASALAFARDNYAKSHRAEQDETLALLEKAALGKAE